MVHGKLEAILDMLVFRTIVIDRTGKVMDTELISSYCKSCDVCKSKNGTKEHNDWKVNPKDRCLINHSVLRVKWNQLVFFAYSNALKKIVY